MLERFSYLVTFEGLSWMGPYMMQHRLHWQVTNTTKHRKGSRKEENVFDHIAHDPVVINQAVETAGMSLDLYAHGEALACLDYYLLSSGKENSTFQPIVIREKESSGNAGSQSTNLPRPNNRIVSNTTSNAQRTDLVDNTTSVRVVKVSARNAARRKRVVGPNADARAN
jgi:hypothetical protein